MVGPLDGKVALVAGATRGVGRGTAVALGEAGATVYCTGRSTRERRSEYDRPETIEETAALVSAAGGAGIAVAVDHLEPGEVELLAQRIDVEHGRLDVLVNDIWGGERLFEWDTPVWEHDLEKGLRMLRLAIDTHMITSHFALPLLIREPGGLVVEMTDGTREYNADRYRVSAFYDLAKTAVIRLAFAQSKELAPHGCTAIALTPGWMRSEMMLEAMGVGEEIPWFSTADDFSDDFGVAEYFGLMVFLRDGDRVFQTYFTDGRGVEALGSIWTFLDLTPLGRQEEWEDSPEGYPQTPPYGWWQLHDEYGNYP